jgi:hypothetical protein
LGNVVNKWRGYDAAGFWNTSYYLNNNYVLQDDNLIIYPNPTHGVVSVKLDNELQNNEYSVEVVDLLGRTLHREFIYNTVTIDVSDLNSGVYLVVLKDKTNILAKQKLLVR